MTATDPYDVIGIGIGPFNLGMAALLDPVDNITAAFFDETAEFNWHPGMLIEGADLQVPFLADLVTFADPTSPYSFINYLHKQNRLHKFFFFNRFDIPRTEYNHYAQWVAGQLNSCHFGKRVTDVRDLHRNGEHLYEVVVEDREAKVTEKYITRHVVMGTGSVPMVPDGFDEFPVQDVVHTSQYLCHRDTFSDAENILVVGSGQSAAEVFLDLLQRQNHFGYRLHWVTRSPGFFQLESGKVGQEIFSPEYVDYFHRLPFDKREEELPNLYHIRNGVEEKTLHEIYDLMYHKSIGEDRAPVTIRSSSDVEKIETGGNSRYQVTCRQWMEEREYRVPADKIVLATGYKPNIPEWLEKFSDDLEWEDDKRFKVTRDYRLVFRDERPNNFFTVTNIEHSHGAGATNLGLAVHRNMKIINEVAGREIYPDQDRTVFQSFGAPEED
ncbi:lysine N(6)-hydroxylase/L-ornithine N(5)-oxygenase family protein [Alteribacter natronophilus]|uniref:lysine N(6)-hydroxylase/L-ornithine N(5)-oxygenase family protein n=1 Tax=Alteribacter natronophilus TaxID=2583810 RepID=UPI00110E8C3D|nr:SidA/IucD/PvdA family monooxygenase [Alteribacter natronophilus]TMW70626.1 ornithine monooxygenase [Alteribacter natronophilus]